MLTAIIIDDEARGRLALREKLAAYCPQIKLLAEAEDGQSALLLIRHHQPELIFLDIEMPRMNGFEMLNELQDKNFSLIFTTAYDQYAIKAIRYAAFDYLLKPVDIQELQTAVNKIEQQKNSQTRQQLQVLQQNMKHPRKLMNRLAVPTLEGLFFYDIHEIVYLEANSNYTTIILNDKTRITASKTLKDLEELLPEHLFFRTHHSFLINLEFIKRYIKGDGGQVEMQNGAIIDVSRRNKEEFLKVIGG